MKNTRLILNTILIAWVSLLMAGPTMADTIYSPMPSYIEDDWNSMKVVGQTKLKRFGFHVYDATFWTKDYSGDEITNAFISNSTCALSITYARKIKVKHLLSNTKKEWLRLGFAERYPIDAWLKILSNIWPDVNKGDQLVFVKTYDGKSTFYNKNKMLGTIDDPEFGTAFLSIWLDEKSRFKRNREELSGERK